jgi:polysaccharide pyruvyl transferase CsaB
MRIALSGYYGFDNAGDEALLLAICSTIENLNSQADFIVFSGNPKKTTQLHGLRAVNRMNPLVVANELLHCDLLISGGGSLFQDVTGPLSLPYYISIVALAKMLKKPVIFYAQGIGPINRNLSKWLMRRFANQVDLITLRDRNSESVLKQIGVMRPPIKVTADPVFTLEPSADDFRQADSLLGEYGLKGEKLIGVSVRNWNNLASLGPHLVKTLDHLAEKGYQILFIPMEYPADVAESQYLISSMKHRACLIDKELSSLQHIALISNFELLLGMRLHSLVFAANRSIPFAGIPYDPKITAFLSLFGLSPLEGDYKQMCTQIDELLDNPGTQEELKKRAREMRSLAEETAHLALSLIDK